MSFLGYSKKTLYEKLFEYFLQEILFVEYPWKKYSVKTIEVKLWLKLKIVEVLFVKRIHTLGFFV